MRKNGEIEHILKSTMLGKISAGSFQGRRELYKHTQCKQSKKLVEIPITLQRWEIHIYKIGIKIGGIYQN